VIFNSTHHYQASLLCHHNNGWHPSVLISSIDCSHLTIIHFITYIHTIMQYSIIIVCIIKQEQCIITALPQIVARHSCLGIYIKLYMFISLKFSMQSLINTFLVIYYFFLSRNFHPHLVAWMISKYIIM